MLDNRPPHIPTNQSIHERSYELRPTAGAAGAHRVSLEHSPTTCKYQCSLKCSKPSMIKAPTTTNLQASISDMSNSKLDASMCYYTVLGLCKQASPVEIRSAYRKLALKWHPDRWMKNDPLIAGDATTRFQQIQEAYSVLSDNGKRLLYDSGLLDFSVDDDDDIDEGFSSDFMQEMVALIECSKHQKRHSLEELQVILGEMMAGDDSIKFNVFGSSRKKTRFGTS